MEASATIRITLGFIFALMLLAFNVAVSYVMLDKVSAAHGRIVATEHIIKLLGDLRAAVSDVESQQRAFILSGEERYLEAHLSVRPFVATSLKELARLTGHDAEESARLVLLGNLIEPRFELVDRVVATRKNQGEAAAVALVESDQGTLILDRIRHAIGEIQNRAEFSLASHLSESKYGAYITTANNAVTAFINVCLLGGLFFLLQRNAAARRKSTTMERNFNDKLAHGLDEVRQRNAEITILSQLSSFLQTCASSEEACTAITRFGPLLFPNESGMIYLFHASRNYVECAALWGQDSGNVVGEEMFPPADCWALRRGRLHATGTDSTSMVCAHVARAREMAQACICAPMMAQGETLGLFFLRSLGSDGGAAAMGDSKQQLAAAVAEQIALALSNLKLREILRQQSLRDPLTGLYNRRFLEASLDRELSRIKRQNLPLSVLMIDVDNFKNFNDTFGHEAGDAVLRDLGGILQGHVRGNDIACRYGGEEFTVILAEADIETGRQRAEMLREAARELRLMHDGKSLGAITLSVGVACFPEHGRRREHLLNAADAALYEAKDLGRNCVVVSNLQPLKVVETPQQRDSGGR